MEDGFKEYSSKQVQNIQAEQRNTLNSKIAILDRLSNEFRENPIFQGDIGKKRQKKVLLYVQKFPFDTKSIVRMNEIFKEKLNLDLSDAFEEFINSKYEKNFDLKPETREWLEMEDFSTSYDKNNVELMRQALHPSLKTRLKNTFAKVKGKLFKHKVQLFLPEALDTEGKVRPASYVARENIQKDNKEQQSWILTQSDKDAIQKANAAFTRKYEKEQNYMANGDREGTDYGEH